MNASRSHKPISTPETRKDLLVNQGYFLKSVSGARGRNSGSSGVRWS